MSDSTAIVNTTGRSEHQAFDAAVLSRTTAPVLTTAHAVRDLIFDVYPETVEVVWPKQGSVGWGTGPKKLSEQFCYFLAFQRHVTLGFYYGGQLADPEGLLGGGGPASGKLSMRSIRIAEAAEVSRPQLRALVREAVRQLRDR